MISKLPQKTYPSGHARDDFKCSGPAAVKDGEFDGTMLADLGCFEQTGKDSNKYYHGAVVQSKIDNKWYAYFEWGRQGVSNPAFQFVECSSKEDAQLEYMDQLKSKNVKRGTWKDHASLGRILVPKIKKDGSSEDMYAVRAQATRSTGLPDAKTIVQNEGGKSVPVIVKSSGSKKTVSIDGATQSLLRDLNVGTVNYTRSSMSDSAIPTQTAIDDARNLLTESQKRLKVVGDDVNDQIRDKDIMDLTRALYSRIPKKKERNAAPETWVLSANNIVAWGLDLDAFESALYSTSNAAQIVNDPYDGMPITMRHLTRSDPIGEFLYSWFPRCTADRHANMGTMKIKNLWAVDHEGETQGLLAAQKKIIADKFRITESPLHYSYMKPGDPNLRPDLTDAEKKIYTQSHTVIGIHGTRTVNLSGLLRKSWVLRTQAKGSGVKLNAAMFGPGIYWADDWKKSAQYTSTSKAFYRTGNDDGSISGRGQIILLADVPLGQAHLAKAGYSYDEPPIGTHCIHGKGGYTDHMYGGKIQNNEWITFGTGRVRMRYVVEFES
jgi:hypothetical protein